jgi:hypothetical protein
MSPCKKKMLFSNVDQELKCHFLSHTARGTYLCHGKNVTKVQSFPTGLPESISRQTHLLEKGEAQLSRVTSCLLKDTSFDVKVLAFHSDFITNWLT